jgi:hypothetical protein
MEPLGLPGYPSLQASKQARLEGLLVSKYAERIPRRRRSGGEQGGEKDKVAAAGLAPLRLDIYCYSYTWPTWPVPIFPFPFSLFPFPFSLFPFPYHLGSPPEASDVGNKDNSEKQSGATQQGSQTCRHTKGRRWGVRRADLCGRPAPSTGPPAARTPSLMPRPPSQMSCAYHRARFASHECSNSDYDAPKRSKASCSS